MDVFEYLSVLLSIVLGLGITQLLLGFSRWLHQRAAYRSYGPAIAWAAFLFLVHVQTWWSMFGLRHWEEWSFLQFSLVLLQPVLLFLLATLIFPLPEADDPDLRSNFFAQRRWLFGLFLALIVVSLLKDLVRSGSLPVPVNLGFHGVLFGVGVVGLATTRDSYHRALAYFALLLFMVYIGLLFAELA